MSDFITLTRANTSRSNIRFMINLDFVIQIEPYIGEQIKDSKAATRIVMGYPDSKISGRQEVCYVQESYEQVERLIQGE